MPCLVNAIRKLYRHDSFLHILFKYENTSVSLYLKNIQAIEQVS